MLLLRLVADGIKGSLENSRSEFKTEDKQGKKWDVICVHFSHNSSCIEPAIKCETVS